MLAAALFPTLLLGSLISSSRIEQCVRTGAGADELACESSKFVLALSVENGQNGTETVEATFSRASDGAGGTRQLQTPWRIELRKTRVMIRYPIAYVRSFNAQPVEEVVVLPSLGCADGSAAESPTCGWAVRDGTRVADSQGFCCTCDFLQTIGASDELTRATSLSCDLFTSQQSAHCLRFGSLWYSAYAVGPAETSFTLELGITSYVDGGNASEPVRRQEVLEIGPGAPGARSADGKIIARLLGDFARPAETPNLEFKYLTVPSSPANHERVLAGVAEWMLIDRSLFTTDGTECNKIGVSYSAFRHESDRCAKRAGSCLGGQLESYRAADAARAAEGRAEQHMVPSFGAFSHVYAAESANHYIAYAWPGMQASVVTLEMAADDVRFITNNAPGEIDMAEVDDFEALSSDGRLVVRFTNVGTIISDFTVSVDCSEGAPDIMPVAAQRRSVRPYFSETVEFALRSESPLQAEMSCRVRLFDSVNAITDETDVAFSTGALVVDRGAQDGEVVGRGPAIETSGAGSAAADGMSGTGLFQAAGRLCDSQCASLVDVQCFVLLSCWGHLGRLLGLAVGALACLLALVGACRSPAVRGCCAGLLCGRDRERKARRRSLMLEDDGRHGSATRARDPYPEPYSAAPQPRPPVRPHEPWDQHAPPGRAPPRDCAGTAFAPYELGAARSLDLALDSARHGFYAPQRAAPAAGRADSTERSRCYINLRVGPDMHALLHSSGERFSLRGRLVRRTTASDGAPVDDKPFAFYVDDGDAVRRVEYDEQLGRHVDLVPPLPVHVAQSVFALSAEQVKALVSDAPRFACLNFQALPAEVDADFERV